MVFLFLREPKIFIQEYAKILPKTVRYGKPTIKDEDDVYEHRNKINDRS